MRTILAGTAFSISALVLWGFTLSRGTGEAQKEPHPGIAHTERSTAPKLTTVAADPRVPVTRARSSATLRLSNFPSAEPRSAEGPAHPLKHPSISPIVPDREGSEFFGDRRPPRAEREDISFATSHKRRPQPAGSPLPLRNTPRQAAQVPATTRTTTDVDPSATPTSTVLSPSLSQAADEDIRYRQIYGQHAWMARHIGMHNGIQEDGPDH